VLAFLTGRSQKAKASEVLQPKSTYAGKAEGVSGMARPASKAEAKAEAVEQRLDCCYIRTT
jgi:hypothetical protein